MMRNEESGPSQSRASTLSSRLKAKFTCNTKRPSINPDAENDMLAAGSQVEKQRKGDSDLTKTLESDEQTSQIQQVNTERRVRRRNMFTKSKFKSIVPNDHNNDNESEEKSNSKRSKSELDNRRKKEKAKIRTRTVSPTRYSDSGSNHHSDAINAAILASITGIPHHGPYNFGNMFSGGDDGGFGGGFDTGGSGFDGGFGGGCDTGGGGCDSGGCDGGGGGGGCD